MHRQIDYNLKTNFCICRINLAFLRSHGNANYPSHCPGASANLLLLLGSRNSWSRADVICTTRRVDTRNFGRLSRYYRASTFRIDISASLTGTPSRPFILYSMFFWTLRIPITPWYRARYKCFMFVQRSFHCVIFTPTFVLFIVPAFNKFPGFIASIMRRNRRRITWANRSSFWDSIKSLL